MRPKIGEVWRYQAVGEHMLVLLVLENEHGSFDVLNIETGAYVTFWNDPETGVGVGEWMKVA